MPGAARENSARSSRASTSFGFSRPHRSMFPGLFRASPAAARKFARSAFSPYTRPSQRWKRLLSGSSEAAFLQEDSARSQSPSAKYARQRRLDDSASAGEEERRRVNSAMVSSIRPAASMSLAESATLAVKEAISNRKTSTTLERHLII